MKVANDEVAAVLDEVGDLIELRDGNPFRVRSYRRAADTIRGLDRSLADIASEEGWDALQDLENVGEGIAGAIREVLETGRLGLLERLRSEASPEEALTRVPGIGDKLAHRIHEQAGIESLEELENAAREGRLDDIEGLGDKRIQGIQDALAGMLSRGAVRRARSRAGAEGGSEPGQLSVELLLSLDEDYRSKAKEGELRKIAPRRFNPEGEAWLPIMERREEGWDFTVLYSNTARAHDLGKTHDWVVIYYERGDREGQCTVVTAGSGRLEGRRVVRGREQECREYYGESG